MMSEQILLVTDGSPSSMEATKIAIEIALNKNTILRIIYILDQGWRNLLGDEWMSSSSNRINFLDWLEGGLTEQAEKILSTAKNQALLKEVKTIIEIKIGKTEKVIIQAVAENKTLLLVLPNPHSTAPSAAGGLDYNLTSLSKKVDCPIFIGPRM